MRQGFVLFRPTDHTGWGNRLRGLTLCYLLAEATERRLLVDDALTTTNFLPPGNQDWTWSNVSKFLGKAPTTKIKPRLSPVDWDESAWRAYQTEDLNSLFPGDNWELNDGLSFADALMLNANYSEKWLAMGLVGNDKIQWMGQAVSTLLSRPSPRFASLLGKATSSSIGIQFRTFYDVGSPHAGKSQAFIDEVLHNLSSRPTGTTPSYTFYVTTDDVKVSRYFKSRLQAHGKVRPKRFPKVLHTGTHQNALVYFLNRIVRKLFIREAFIRVDKLLPPAWRVRAESRVLADWFRLGECSEIFSTFTSFSVFAAARTGNKARLWRFDVETQQISEMTNNVYYF